MLLLRDLYHWRIKSIQASPLFLRQALTARFFSEMLIFKGEKNLTL